MLQTHNIYCNNFVTTLYINTLNCHKIVTFL